jgi:hypothetical protein
MVFLLEAGRWISVHRPGLMFRVEVDVGGEVGVQG